jgi:hypothetical protein
VSGHSSRRHLYTWTAALLLGILFAQAMTSIPHLSITFDEDVHISTGYSVLCTGDMRLVEDHPPLIEYWMSWPLLLSPDVPRPEEIPTWEQGDRRLFVRNEMWWNLPIDTWVIPPRIPVSWLALLLGAFLFRWATEWFGLRSGLLALAFFVFDPNILAHGTLATLDLGVTCFIFIAMYGIQHVLRRPSCPNLIIGGVFLGLALGTKISAFIVLPIGVALMVVWGVMHRPKGLLLWGLVYPALYVSVALLTLWGVHLFDFGPLPETSIPLPAPTYWNSFLRVGRHVSAGDPAYVMGETYVGGRWDYFPIVFALKTPLPTLMLTGAALWTALVVAWRNPRQRLRELVLASLPASYSLMSIASQINLGYRHILPILPFLYVYISRLATLCPSLKGDEANRASRFAFHVSRLRPFISCAALFALLLWQIIGTLCVWPFHLTFFNEIVGGPDNGYRYLADSNVDWGQGLKALRSYLEAQSWSDVRLSSFTFFIRPDLYGIQAEPLPPLAAAPAILPSRFNPAPGTYVISASTLRGLQLIDREMYNWFWHRQPDDVIANAMLVYHVPEQDPGPTWLAQCSVPVVPLSPEAVVEGFGLTDLRLLAFDCTQSWLYPDAGESAGWYVLHRETAERGNGFIQRQLDQVSLGFEQKTPHQSPPLSIFEWVPKASALSDVQESIEKCPISLDGPLAFLGYTVTQGEQDSTLLTYWQVISKPERAFSLMAHLVSKDDHHVSVGDGLGIPWHELKPGDVLVQRHLLSLPEDLPSGSYHFQTGGYWLDTMERWALRDEEEPAKDYIRLTDLEVSR